MEVHGFIRKVKSFPGRKNSRKDFIDGWVLNY